jgi:hypothetical protein
MLAVRSPRISAQTSAPQRNDAECHKRPNAPQQKAAPRNPMSGIAGCCARATTGHTASEQRDEFAALHSITSSARASSVGGMSRPSALALFNYRLDITDLSSVALFCRPAANARENRCMTCPSLSGSHTPKLSRETIVSWSWMIITRFPSSILKFARIGHLHGVNHMKHQVGHRAESAGPMRPLGDS